ncbi:hypothetical protein V1478_012336 [Vespula squamosa]|uniref:Uncharacterized protein n=1 Tax=Vespula squamosa TaxID=30214 RepID=A0ABD2AFK1_VESSQ
MPSCSFTTLKLCGPVVLRNLRLQDREALAVLFSPNSLRNVLSLECQSAFYYCYGFGIIEISFDIVELEGLMSIYRCIYELRITSLLNITKENEKYKSKYYEGNEKYCRHWMWGFADGHTRLKLPGRGH